jgi:hypothetical protein
MSPLNLWLRRPACRLSCIRSVLLLALLTAGLRPNALADGFSPWVRSVSVTGDQSFNIYDRTAGALIENPVYRHFDPKSKAETKPAGFVQSSAASLAVDLDGTVPIKEPILVQVDPRVVLNGEEITVTPSRVTVAVQQWSDNDGKNVTFALDLPAGVGKHDVSIAWQVATSTDGGETWFVEPTDQSQHTIYTTVARPIVSQTYLGLFPERGNPWIDMLERSTVWAFGLTDPNDVMEALAVTFWANSDHIYDGGAHSTPTDYNTLNVERFLDPRIDPQADCRDMSNFLALLARSLGLNVTTFRIRGGAIGRPSFFWTQYLGPHGGHQPAQIVRSIPPNRTLLFTSMEHGWTQTLWNYHQVAFFNGRLYDACAKIELEPFVPRNPSNINNHRDLREFEAALIGYEYIPDGDYVPNNEGFLLNFSYEEYQPYLVLDEYPFASSSYIEQQGAAPIVR